MKRLTVFVATLTIALFWSAVWGFHHLARKDFNITADNGRANQLDLIVQANQKLEMYVESGDVVHADICLYGGTPGGITAAISAAREGASVILLECPIHAMATCSGKSLTSSVAL